MFTLRMIFFTITKKLNNIKFSRDILMFDE